jgi:hypothetical protein
MATGRGSVAVGAATPWVASIRVQKSRNSTGSPSVRKYASPGRPRRAAAMIPAATLRTWQVLVRWCPPPIQRSRPDRAAATTVGSSVVSPRPHTMRGRTAMPPAASTARSACCFVAA